MEGSMLLKIQSFLVVQILQAIRIMISMKKGAARWRLIWLMMVGTLLVVITEMPIEFQHAFAKLHRMKR
jgi:hypothetical protein